MSSQTEMVISALVLDMDGLMLDTEPLYKTAWQQAAAELGFDLDDESYSRLTGRPTRDCEQELMTRFGPGFPLPQFRTRWTELWRLLVDTRGIARKAGLSALLSLVDDEGLSTAVATSSDADYAQFSLRTAGIANRFDTVVSGDQVARGKPAPDIYLEAADRLGCHPIHCVALEDSDAGVLAASAAGMVTLCVPDLKPPSADAARAATEVLSSLHEAREWINATVARGRAAPDRFGPDRRRR